ncbi:helicase-associated domain-containing protein [Subtercola endophyticus]|uniref:helicase-associated domain-containing protein n=1 Tax=Subtercola endophyticus TaxID=2895559 RepID=UPI001E589FEF|nr:helicase-associated domain-containing protein [Subtercola endophyticus]UFS59607.1 helicase-associated domain-containing protein [Subtercola endophyticus]
MSDTLALAGRLQLESDDALVWLLTARHLARRDLRDFFDLADALLTPDSIQDALSKLDRPTLAALAAGDTPVSTASSALTGAVALMLAHDVEAQVTPYDSVVAVLDSWPNLGLPSVAELSSVTAPEVPAPSSTEQRAVVDRVSAERALATTVAVTELVIALETTPARELAKGGVAVPDAKRLSAATGLAADDVNAIIRLARLAGLAQRDGLSWHATAHARRWVMLPLAERWGQLAAAWLQALPTEIAGVLRGMNDSYWAQNVVDYLRWLYPAGGEALLSETNHLLDDADRLGITGADTTTAMNRTSAAGNALLVDGEAAAVQTMRHELPPEVSTVYLQHDLTVVAPGPLRPDLDATLRAMTQIESHQVASSYRFSSGSIAKALGAGYSAESIRAFLAEISVTGIPQPLEYLIAESSARYGLLRAGRIVAESGEQAGSYVRSDDRSLLHTVAVDQSLSSLGLVFVNPLRLVSRFELETVYWMLVDARYPVIAEAESGHPTTLTRSQPAPPAPAQPTHTVAELVNRLRGSGVQGNADTEEAWLVRQLDAAVKNKSTVLVTVTMPNGTEVVFPMVPTSVASGRMRGTDQKAGVERTLPLASITQVAAASSVS